jgi:hypothetical protein
MAEQRVQRKLAAMLAADVVGYSRLVEANETDTLAGVVTSSAISLINDICWVCRFSQHR